MAAAEHYHGFVGVQGRGLVALPAVLRRRYGLDLPGAQVEITERADGVLEIRPTVAIPAAQSWFWTDEWQVREREVDVAVEEGRVTRYEGPDEFLAGLDVLDGSSDEQAGGKVVPKTRRRRR